MGDSKIKITPAQINGAAGEAFAIDLYRKAKFEILEIDYRHGRSQVDFVAKRGNCVHFVEVKFRQTLDPLRRPVSQAQLQRIARVAEAYMINRENALWQIDIICVDRHFRWQRIDNISVDMH